MTPDTVVHRIGGSSVPNLRLKPAEAKLSPPGISVLLGGTPQEAAAQIRRAYKHATRLQQAAHVVASTTVSEIRQAGFDILAQPTNKFPNHAVIVHVDGAVGFSNGNLTRLSQAFRETQGC